MWKRGWRASTSALKDDNYECRKFGIDVGSVHQSNLSNWSRSEEPKWHFSYQDVLSPKS